jgi:glycosyltransferase involved in cell wall biosynthesis
MVLDSTHAPCSPQRLRVAVDLSTMLPGGENGGVKPFALETIKALMAMKEEEICFIFLTWSKSHDEVATLARASDQVICVRNDAATSPHKKASLNTSFDLLLGYEVAVLYSPFSCCDFACPGIPMVTTVVDLLHKDYPLSLTPIQVETRENNFQFLLKATSIFQCISKYTAKQLQLHYGVKKEQCLVTHIAIHKRLEITSANLQSELTKRYFLYPANAWVHKNHNTLLVAYRLYLNKNPQGWDLILTGYLDEGMACLKETAQALGIGEKVRFLGHVPTDFLAKLWKDAGALVFPSLHEGFGIPLVEAMQFGIPILCSEVGSLPEVASDAAFYVNTKDPMALAEGLKLISTDNQLRSSLTQNGFKRLESFNLEASTELLYEILSKSKDTYHMYSRGIYKDGWTSHKAAIVLPKLDEITVVRLTLGPIPEKRRLRLYRGSIPYGGYAIDANKTTHVTVLLKCDGLPLVLEVLGAGKLGHKDTRDLGVMIQNIVLIKKDGTEIPLAYKDL